MKADQESTTARSPEVVLGRLAGRVGLNGMLLAALGVLLAVFIIPHSSEFATLGNVENIAVHAGALLVVSLGQMVVLLVGGFDISVGATMGFVSVVTALVITDHTGLPGGILVGLLTGGVIGIVNGLLVARVGISPFVVTLAMLTFLLGLGNELSGGASVSGLPDAFKYLGGTDWGFGIPSSVAIAVIASVAMWFVLGRSRLGLYLYGIGGSRDTCRLAGVPVRRYEIAAYSLCGFLAGLAGIMVSSRTTVGQAELGTGFELTSIVACVVGGVVIGGGVGRLSGVVFGVVLFVILQNGMDIAGIGQFRQEMITGGVLIGVVALSQLNVRAAIAAVARRSFWQGILEGAKVGVSFHGGVAPPGSAPVSGPGAPGDVQAPSTPAEVERPAPRAKTVRPRVSFFGQRRRAAAMELQLFAGLLVIFAVFASLYPREFLTLDTVRNMASVGGILLVVSLGQMFVLVVGGFDISVGATMGFVATVSALGMSEGSLTSGLLLGLAAAILIGLTNGIVCGVLKVSPLIATLGMLTFLLGFGGELTSGVPVFDFAPGFEYFGGRGTWGPLPSALGIALIAVAVAWYILGRLRLGIHIYAVGGAREACRLAGVRVVKTEIIAYALCGLLAGVAGIMIASRTTVGQVSLGEGYALLSIATAVLGGAAIGGGRGRVTGVVLGVTLLTVLRTGLDIAGIGEFIQEMVTGGVLVAAVWISLLQRNRVSHRPSFVNAPASIATR